MIEALAVEVFAMTSKRCVSTSDPRVKGGQSEQRLTITVPPDIDQELRRFARESDRSVAAVVRLALRRLLAEDTKKRPA